MDGIPSNLEGESVAGGMGARAFDSWEPRNTTQFHHLMNCIKGLLGRDAEWKVSLSRSRDNKGLGIEDGFFRFLFGACSVSWWESIALPKVLLAINTELWGHGSCQGQGILNLAPFPYTSYLNTGPESTSLRTMN